MLDPSLYEDNDLSMDDYWDRYVAARKRMNRQPGISRPQFEDVLHTAGIAIERAVAFNRLHTHIQMQLLEAQTEISSLRVQLNEAQADLQRALTYFEDQEG